jgi:hypothetical protein
VSSLDNLWTGTEGNLVIVNAQLSRRSWLIDIPSAKKSAWGDREIYSLSRHMTFTHFYYRKLN